MTGLLDRLRKVDGSDEGTHWYRNPDGPEAAVEIERLRAENNSLRWQLTELGQRLQIALDDAKEWERAREGLIKDGSVSGSQSGMCQCGSNLPPYAPCICGGSKSPRSET